MNLHFGKAIPRRTALRGLGVTVGLPLLDAMVPAFAAAQARTAVSPPRFSIVYVPNGMTMEHWTPAEEGRSYELTTVLKPLASFREQFLVLTGLAQRSAYSLPNEGGAGPHERASATYLTGVHPRRTNGTDIRVGPSVDQLAAQMLGAGTRVGSLELGMDAAAIGGACENGWSCAYINTLSWRTPTTPLPLEDNPRRVFERLFGDADTNDPAAREAQSRKSRSVLDSVRAEASSLLKALGPDDRRKLTEYLDAVRDVEHRIVVAESQAAPDTPTLDRPSGIPETFQEHAKLMFDLQVLAYRADMTRVITFLMGREKSERTYREIGISDPHHPLSHHSNNPEMIAKVLRINVFHATLFAYYLEKLRATPDGDGSLLDHLVLLYGSSMSDGNDHSNDNLPVLVAGGRIAPRGGGHLRYPSAPPMPNLYLTMLDRLGVDVARLGDSTGRLDLLPI